MIRHMALAAAILAAPALAQTPGGTVGSTQTAPYAPTGAMPAPGVSPSGLGSAMAPGSPMAPTLAQPATGVPPPVGAASAGTTGDGRVGTLAPNAATPPSSTPPSTTHQ